MAGLTGSGLYLKFGGTVLNTDYRAFNQNESIGKVDDSAGADSQRHYLTTLNDGIWTASIVAQASDVTTRGTLVPGTGGVLEVGLEGTAAGKQKSTVASAFVEERRVAAQYADLIMYDISWQLNAAVVEGTY